MEKNCLHCENIFTVINKNKRFCSERCQQNKWRKDNKERVLKTKKNIKKKILISGKNIILNIIKTIKKNYYQKIKNIDYKT